MGSSEIGCLATNLCALMPPLGQMVVNYKCFTDNEFYLNSTLSIPTVCSYLALYVWMALYFLVCDDNQQLSWSRGWIVAYFVSLAIMYLYICLQWYGFRRFSPWYSITNKVPTGTITYVDYGTEHSAAAADFGLSSATSSPKTHQGLDHSLLSWDGRSSTSMRSVGSLQYNAPVLAALLAISPIQSANALPIPSEGLSSAISGVPSTHWLALLVASLFFAGKFAQLVKHFTAKCVVGVSVLFYLCEMLQLTLILCAKTSSVFALVPIPHETSFTFAFLVLDMAILLQFALYQANPKTYDTPLERVMSTPNSEHSRLIRHDLSKPNMYMSVRED